jgi:hypothetical protein
MEAAALFVVPIRIGGGTRLKIFEAMAMGMPVVSTPVGAEGLPVRDGEDVVRPTTPRRSPTPWCALLRDRRAPARLGPPAAARGTRPVRWASVAARSPTVPTPPRPAGAPAP